MKTHLAVPPSDHEQGAADARCGAVRYGTYDILPPEHLTTDAAKVTCGSCLRHMAREVELRLQDRDVHLLIDTINDSQMGVDSAIACDAERRFPGQNHKGTRILASVSCLNCLDIAVKASRAMGKKP